MVEPRTYIGYDKDNKEITRHTATDANTYINPEEVQAKIDALDEVADGEIANIVSNMQSITADEKDAVIIQGTNMDTILSDTQNAVNGIKGSFGASLGEVYTASVQAHDEIQNQLNESAKGAVQATPGGVTVSGQQKGDCKNEFFRWSI